MAEIEDDRAKRLSAERALLRLKQIARVLGRPLEDFFHPSDDEPVSVDEARAQTPDGGGEDA